MEFLKHILKDDYDMFVEKINAYNEANPENAVQLADISGGGYIEKAVHEGVVSELEAANSHKTTLETEIKKCRFDAALDIALTKAGARNTIAARALMDGVTDTEKISESVEVLKRENPYLFDTPLSTGMSQGSPAGTFNANEEIRNTLFGKNK